MDGLFRTQQNKNKEILNKYSHIKKSLNQNYAAVLQILIRTKYNNLKIRIKIIN